MSVTEETHCGEPEVWSDREITEAIHQQTGQEEEEED